MVGPASKDPHQRMAGELYYVFARSQPGDPVQHMGVVKAPSPSLAYLYAKMNYREKPWHHMMVVPKSACYEGGDELVVSYVHELNT